VRAKLAAALACAALVAAGCTEKTGGTAQGVGSPTTPSAAATGLPTTAPSSLPASADFPSSIPETTAPLPTRPTQLPPSVDCTYEPDTDAPAAKPVSPPADEPVSSTFNHVVDLVTSVGQITITLRAGLGPCAVHSFTSLVAQHYYDNTPCHRLTTVEALQVLQCGDPSGKGTGGPGYTFKDELFDGMTYGRGTVAMANAGPDTNGSQFFIVYGGADGLQPNYTIFGSIDAPSLQVIDTVAKSGVNPTNGPGDGAPIMPITIASASTR
jgi:peptidyl-prolyl cis-trans isomerase B (cyclophilin B)